MNDADNETEKLLSDVDITDRFLCEKGKCVHCKNAEDFEECYELCFAKHNFKQEIAFKTRVNSICVGASNILSENVKHACLVSSFLIVLLATVTIILLLAVYMKQKGQMNMHRRNVFCKETTEGDYNTMKNSVSHFLRKSDKIYVEPKNSLFYVIDEPLTKEQACNIESVLRVLPDKLIYIIEMNNEKMHKYINFDYITFLQKSYDNINRIKADKEHLFQGSLFENILDKTVDPLLTLAAKVLIVWQFGGAAFSEDLLMTSRNIFDKCNNICMADKDLLYCPHECSAYTYGLMKEIVNRIKSNSSSISDFDDVIDNSINDICCEDTTKTGCNLVYRLQDSDLCNGRLNVICQFARINKSKYQNYRETLKHFCKYVSSTF